MPAGRRFPRRARLLRGSGFQVVYAQGSRWVGKNMVLWTQPGLADELHLGVVASRRVGPAVRRNRCKRRLREVVRLCWPDLARGYHIVLIARWSAATAPWPVLQAEFERLARNAGLLNASKTV